MPSDQPHQAKRNGKLNERKGKSPAPTPLSRDEVMRDFRRIAGPLRGRNRDRSPKS